MDLESVTEELYGLHPQDFTAARSQQVAAARTAGDRALARQIQTLRRPTLAAWASNLLVRTRPDEVTSLLALGEGLRQAHRDLDGGQLRELSRQQHVVVSALASQARKLAAEAGHPVSEEVQREVAETLHAALADPQAAQEWAAGRLPKPLAAPVGFTPAAWSPSPSPSPGPSARDRPDTEKGGGAREREQEVERQRRLAEARKEARAAQEVADAREEELRQAEADSEEAASRLREAEQQRADLARQLETAEQQVKTARTAAHQAQTQAKDAARAADHARRRASEAVARAERSA
ncbi:hypothetical protein ACQEVX_35800 [Streptomyces syringium]|uniref:hypothetical protein n=1 Tax=Streptomyces syringium TaxID=76729 RepID=UPI003D911147